MASSELRSSGNHDVRSLALVESSAVLSRQNLGDLQGSTIICRTLPRSINTCVTIHVVVGLKRCKLIA
jgi:hypothetical protein